MKKITYVKHVKWINNESITDIILSEIISVILSLLIHLTYYESITDIILSEIRKETKMPNCIIPAENW